MRPRPGWEQQVWQRIDAPRAKRAPAGATWMLVSAALLLVVCGLGVFGYLQHQSNLAEVARKNEVIRLAQEAKRKAEARMADLGQQIDALNSQIEDLNKKMDDAVSNLQKATTQAERDAVNSQLDAIRAQKAAANEAAAKAKAEREKLTFHCDPNDPLCGVH